MNKATYWQRGEAIDYVNKTEETIEAGTVVAFGDRIGVAGTDIAPGETGSLHVEGVFEFPKGEEVVGAGTDVYVKTTDMLSQMQELATSSANGTYNSTVKTILSQMQALAIPSADGTYNSTVKAGYAAQDADAGAETVLVKINA